MRARVLERVIQLSRQSSRGVFLNSHQLFSELRRDQVNSRQLDNVEAAVSQLAGRLEAVMTHGDLNPSNVLLHRGHVAFVDWTWGCASGIPCFDWFDLIGHACLGLQGWERVALDLENHSGELRRIYLEGASEILRCPEKAEWVLRLYQGTRLHNLQLRERAQAERRQLA